MAQSFTSYQRSEQTGQRMTRRRPMAVVIAPITCRTDGGRYNPRFQDQTWVEHRTRLEQLYASNCNREDIRKTLRHECAKQDCNFRPTLPQLNRKMKSWGLSKHFREDLQGPTTESNTQTETPPRSDCNSTPPTILTGSDQVHDPDHVSDCPLDKTNDRFDSMHLESSNDEARSSMGSSSSQISPNISQRNLCATAKDITVNDANDHDTDAQPLPIEASQYCTEVCCKRLFDCHNTILAASFLAGLGCWERAASLLERLLGEVEEDSSVSVSDRIWVKLLYRRFGGTVVTSRSETDFSSTGSWTEPSEALISYANHFEQDIPPNALGYLCLTTQYRATGMFEYYLHNAAAVETYSSQVQALSTELQQSEEQDKQLLGLILWCAETLKHTALRTEVEKISKFADHSEKLQSTTLPRMLACHFMCSWIQRPSKSMLQHMADSRPKEGAYFLFDVMLPELFIAIAGVVVKSIKVIPSTWTDFVEELIRAVRKSIASLWHGNARRYCDKIAASIISNCNTSSTSTHPDCYLSECLAMNSMMMIMATGGTQFRGTKDLDPWMRTAECFKVHSLPVEISGEADLFVAPSQLLRSSRSTGLSQLAETEMSSSHQDLSYAESVNQILNSTHKVADVVPKDQDAAVAKQNIGTTYLPRRFPTSSSEEGFRDISSRVRTEIALRGQQALESPCRNASQTSSGSSRTRMSWKPCGLDRSGSNTSKLRFSYFTGCDEQLDLRSPFDTLMPSPLGSKTSSPFGTIKERFGGRYIEKNPYVSKWVDNQNGPGALERSSSAV